MSKCPICDTEANKTALEDFDGYLVSCSRCGNYRIAGIINATLSSTLQGDERKIANASGWIREHQNELIGAETVTLIETLRAPSVTEKAERLLRHLGERCTYFGEQFGVSLSEARSPSGGTAEGFLPILELMGVAWAINGDEVIHLLKYLGDEHLLEIKEFSTTKKYVSVSAKGLSHIERLNAFNPESNIGFCAMWFNDSVKPIWTQAISPAISDAGYESKRIDEHHHNNRIDDEIITLIRRSKFVVADFTGQRGGVYFEAGFALGMNLPVIWTVKKSELSSVHFDNRQYNFVTWEEGNLPEFKLNLQYRIEATLGRGTWKSDA